MVVKICAAVPKLENLRCAVSASRAMNSNPSAKRSAVIDIGHPPIAEPCRAPQCRIGTPAAPNRRTAGRGRFRQHRNRSEAEIFAAMLDRLARPQPLHDLDRFVGASAAFLYRNSACFVFGGKFAAHSDA